MPTSFLTMASNVNSPVSFDQSSIEGLHTVIAFDVYVSAMTLKSNVKIKYN